MAEQPSNKSLTNQSTADFAQIETWVFDLDNTLYPVTEKLLAQIDQHMGSFVSNFLNVDAIEARRIQKTYFRKYGLTLRGLMLHHGLDPIRYYNGMTAMDLSQVDPNPELAESLRRLPGRKLIYTNASAQHAEMVLDRLGMADVFESIYDITAAEYVPKPAIESYQILCEQYAIDPSRAVMIDDIARNLEPAATLGMKTVWMRTGAEWAQDVAPEPYIDHITRDILQFIQGISDTAN